MKDERLIRKRRLDLLKAIHQQKSSTVLLMHDGQKADPNAMWGMVAAMTWILGEEHLPQDRWAHIVPPTHKFETDELPDYNPAYDRGGRVTL